jgi:hypothetical protein
MVALAPRESKNFDLIAIGETMLALAPVPGETVEDREFVLLDHAGAAFPRTLG